MLSLQHRLSSTIFSKHIERSFCYLMLKERADG